MPENCRENIVSEHYIDFIWKSNYSIGELEYLYPGYCIQPVNDLYAVFYIDRDILPRYNSMIYDYEVFPTLYTLLENENLQESGILQLQNNPVLQLQGEGVILGIIDTGIDYTNDCFRGSDGSTRILEIWDQEDQSGTLPEGIDYGSVYTQEDINRALQSADPYEIVPSRDKSGHGTQIASIAGGSTDEQRGWRGAAPKADLAVVRLKPAKKYLKEYFMVNPDITAYQENDIMLGVRYLNELAFREKKPLVICIALGSNKGGHEGTSPLSSFLTTVGARSGRCIVIAGGNEANQRHHYYGTLKEENQYEEVELRVAENEYGLMMELWSSTPDVLSISLISPAGEEIPRITTSRGTRQYDFLFEQTVVYIDFQSLNTTTGEQLIVIRMHAPSAGIWRLRVYATSIIHGIFNIWLPIRGFISEDTAFLAPNPDITLTSPANSEIPITVAAYQVQNRSIYISSSRGYTRRGRIKPDIAAPGVDVEAFEPKNRFTSVTGTSAAAAITAGAAALFLEWGVVRGNRPQMGTLEIKQLMIRGAKRSSSNLYPNRSWGYGTLDLYTAFQELGRF
jgi:subtilisin family serine protease